MTKKKAKRARPALGSGTFIERVELREDEPRDARAYPFSIPAVRALEHGLDLHPRVTFFVGENGSGKSTVLEAIAVAAGFNAEGGTRNFNFRDALASPPSPPFTDHLRVPPWPRAARATASSSAGRASSPSPPRSRRSTG